MIRRTRLAMVMVSIFYLLSLSYAYSYYLYPAWGYYGFSYHERSSAEIIFILILTILGSLVVPIRLEKPSSFILITLFTILYIPILIVTSYVTSDSLEKYGLLLTSFGIGFIIMSLIPKAKLKSKVVNKKITIRWSIFKALVIIVWVFSIAIFFYYYGGHMNFVTITNTYTQRELTGSLSVPFLISYVQSLFFSVISAFFMAYGLITKKLIWFLAGAVGLFVMYSITASKSAFAMPFLYLLIYYVISKPFLYKYWSILSISFISIITFASTFFYSTMFFWKYTGALFVFRFLGIPALSFSQYYDYFSLKGFTWWSHVKGFSLFIPPPFELQNDSAWPNLGFLIGHHVYNTNVNVNANFFSGDGIAAGGSTGIVIISILFGLWLRLLDNSTQGWNKKFVLLSLLTYSIFLTNAHFFTSLLSFGGIFWLLFFRYVSLGNDWHKALKK